MVPIRTRGVCEDQSLQPFDTASAYLAGNNNAQRTTVIWTERFPIHFVGEHDASIEIQGPVELDRCAIVSIGL